MQLTNVMKLKKKKLTLIHRRILFLCFDMCFIFRIISACYKAKQKVMKTECGWIQQ